LIGLAHPFQNITGVQPVDLGLSQAIQRGDNGFTRERGNETQLPQRPFPDANGGMGICHTYILLQQTLFIKRLFYKKPVNMFEYEIRYLVFTPILPRSHTAISSGVGAVQMLDHLATAMDLRRFNPMQRCPAIVAG
jgi:hypothetical protein